jgi:ribosomal protection tetracycline resistance protein
VLHAALTQAGTVVCEPIMQTRVETPSESLGAVLALLSRLGAAVGAPTVHSDLSIVEATLPAARAQELRTRLPGITSGEGVVESELAGYRPV